MNTPTMTTRQRTTGRTTMQAITQDRYGEAEDVLRLEEIARPAIGEEEVLLRVHAAGVDRGVWHLMTGLPYPVRLAGYGIRAPKTPVRGREVAGRVEVTGVCRTAKMDTVRSLGADHVIDYTREDIAVGGRRYDVILDIGGNRSLNHLRCVLDPRGTLVIVGGETGGRWLAGSDRQLRALLLSPFTSQTLTTLICSENTPDLLALTTLIESGQVRPVIDRTYSLSQTPTAIQYMRDAHAQGKVVINL